MGRFFDVQSRFPGQQATVDYADTPRVLLLNVIYEGTPHGGIELAQSEPFSHAKSNFPHYRGVLCTPVPHMIYCKIYVAMAHPLLWPTRALADSRKLDKQCVLPKKVLRLLTKLRLSKRPIYTGGNKVFTR